MKLIIAGSRGINDYKVVRGCFLTFIHRELVTEIVSGGARGVDKLGEQIADEFDLIKTIIPADWNNSKGYDRLAGYKRNEDMAKYANGLLAIWDFESRGTKHMIDVACDSELYVEVYNRNGVCCSRSRY